MSLVSTIRETHSRYGHQNPRQMAETVARQARADIPPYTSEEVLKVMQRWPCIYCSGASARKGAPMKDQA